MKETKLRSFTKSIIWRVISIIITWIVVGSLSATLIAAGLSMIAYYIHERVWNKILWGKI